MRVFLVDDEPFAIRRLTLSLRDVPDVEIVGTASNGDAALVEIRRLRPDLAIVDVEMPGRTGIALAGALEKEDGPEIIFLTAFDRYASDAFSVEAIDYLLKPLKPERLHQALRRARRRQLEKHSFRAVSEPLAPINGALQEYGTDHPRSPSIHIPDRHGGFDLPQSEVVWIEAAKDYALIHTHTRTLILRTTMSDLSDQLLPSIMRVHRSAFVSANAVHHWLRSSKGLSSLVLTDGTEVQVGPSYVQTVKKSIPPLASNRR